MSALGTAAGEVTRWLDAAARRRAQQRIDRAFPAFRGNERRRLVRLAFRHRGRARALDRSMTRRSAVEFCSALALEGWERLAEAASHGRGVIAVTAPFGLQATVRRALTLYRSAIDIATAGCETEDLLQPLARGATIVTGLEPRGLSAHLVRAPLFGVELTVSSFAGELASRAGAPVVTVLASPEAGGVRLLAGHPIAMREGAATAAEITRRLVRSFEAHLGRRPELFPWMEPFAESDTAVERDGP